MSGQFVVRMVLSCVLLYFVWRGDLCAIKFAVTLSLIAHEFEAMILKMVIKVQSLIVKSEFLKSTTKGAL